MLSKKANILKQLLIIASVVAVMVGSTCAAMGTSLETSGGNLTLSAPGNTRLTGGGAAQGLVSGDSLDIRNAGVTITADVPGFNIQGVRLSAAPGILTVNQNLTLGSVADTGGGGNTLGVQLGNATLTLSGTASGAFNSGLSVPVNTYNMNVSFTSYGTLNANTGLQGNVVLSNGGNVAVTGAVTGNITSVDDASAPTLSATGGINGNVDIIANTVVTVTGGNVSGTLNVTGKFNAGGQPYNTTGRFVGGGANIGGLVTINSGYMYAPPSVIQDAGGGVTAPTGLLNMRALTGGNMSIGTAIITASGLVGGNVSFTGNGTLNANAGIQGDVALDNGGNVVISGAPLTGNVTSPGGGNLSTAQGITGDVTAANNTIIRVTGGNVSGNLNVTGSAQFTGAGANIGGMVTVDNNASCTIQNAGGGVTADGGYLEMEALTGGNMSINTTRIDANGLVNGDVTFTGNGNLNAFGGLTGDVDFAGNDGTLSLGDGQILTGNVDSTGSSGGTLNFGNGGTVNGAIGPSHALTGIYFYDTGLVNLGNGNVVNAKEIVVDYGVAVTAGGAINTTGGAGVSFENNGSGTLNANGGFTGNVALNNDGNMTVAGAALTGNVTSPGSGTLSATNGITGNVAVANNTVITVTGGNVGGTLGVTGAGRFTGATANIAGAVTINSTDATGSTIQDATAGLVTLTAGKLTMRDAAVGVIATAGTLNMRDSTGGMSLDNATVTTSGSVGGNVSFTGAGTLNAGGGITGNVALDNGGNVAVAGAALTGNVTSPGSGTLSATNGITGNVAVANNTVITVTGGNVGGTLGVTGAGRFTGATANIAGAVTINSTDATGSTIQDATAGLVTLTAGKLTMRDAAVGVIATAGTLNMRDSTGGMSLDNATVTTSGPVDGDVSFTGNGILNANAGITGNVDFGGNAGTLNLATDITGNIDSAVASNGTLRFTGGATVTGTIGATNPIERIIFEAGGGVGAVINFNSAIYVSNNTYIFNTADTVNAGISFGNIDFKDQAGTWNATGLITGDVYSTGGIKGTLNLNAGSGVAGSIGTGGEIDTVNFNAAGGANITGDVAAKNLNFQEDASIGGATNTDTVQIAAGKKATFSGSLVASNELTLANDDGAGVASTAEFGDNTVIDSSIVATVVGEGIVNFLGSTDVKKNIGNVAAINFNGDDIGRSKQIKLFNNMSGMVNFKKATVILQNNVNMAAGASFAGSSIELGNQTLTISNGNVTFTGDVEVKTDIAAGTFGNIAINAGPANNIDLSGINTLTVIVNDNSAGAINNEYNVITMASGNITPFDATKIKINNSGSVYQWKITYSPDGTVTVSKDGTVSPPSGGSSSEGGASFSFGGSEPIHPVVPNSALQDTNKLENPFENLNIPDELVPDTIVQMFDNVAEGSAAANLIQSLQSKPESERRETMIRLINATTTPDAIADSVNDVTDQMTSRTDSLISSLGIGLSSSEFLVSFDDDHNSLSGVAAGDQAECHGVWTSTFYSKNIQKKLGLLSAGHTAYSGGLTIGFDTRITETAVLGGATTFINTKVKYKDFKSGDKTLIDSTVLTLYGVSQIFDNMHLQGIVNFASSNIKNSDIRGSGDNKQIAKGKYNTRIFSGEISGGYNFIIGKQVMITPIAGLSYLRFDSSSYKEYGTTAQNLSITMGASHKVGGVLGIRTTFEPYKAGNLLLSPEVHAYIRQDLKAKNPKVDVRLDGINNNMAKETTKPARKFITLGTILNARYGRSEYGFGYDATLSNKYIGHQGTIKVRIEF